LSVIGGKIILLFPFAIAPKTRKAKTTNYHTLPTNFLPNRSFSPLGHKEEQNQNKEP